MPRKTENRINGERVNSYSCAYDHDNSKQREFVFNSIAPFVFVIGTQCFLWGRNLICKYYLGRRTQIAANVLLFSTHPKAHSSCKLLQVKLTYYKYQLESQRCFNPLKHTHTHKVLCNGTVYCYSKQPVGLIHNITSISVWGSKTFKGRTKIWGRVVVRSLSLQTETALLKCCWRHIALQSWLSNPMDWGRLRTRHWSQYLDVTGEQGNLRNDEVHQIEDEKVMKNLVGRPECRGHLGIPSEQRRKSFMWPLPNEKCVTFTDNQCTALECSTCDTVYTSRKVTSSFPVPMAGRSKT